METATLRELIDTVRNSGKKYCFILGAGASKASGIKTGSEMAKEWLNEMEELNLKDTQIWMKEKQIDKEDLGTHYSKIYERRFRIDPAGGFKRLQEEMKKATPSSGYYYLAEILNGTHNKLVITTNFDSLTEDALFIYKDEKALVITHESLAKYVNALSDRPIIIKLHRDLLLQPKSKETEVNNLPDEWKKTLEKIFDIYDPIVIGYGGNDESLMGFLDSAASKSKTIYWCCRKGEQPNEKIEELLKKYNGFLIPIDDFDDTMHNFGAGFNFIFSEETIQNVTKERASKLVNKYNEWHENRRKALGAVESRSDTENMTFESFKSVSNKRIAELEKLIANGQGDATVHYKLGHECNFEAEYSNSLKHFTKAIELDPHNAEYYYSRGKSYDWLSEYEKAIEDKTKAIELDPNNAEYYYSRGKSYDWLSEYEKAIEDKTKAIELDPYNAGYYGKPYYNLNDFEKVIEDKTKAIELDPNNAGYYNSRGESYDWLNKYEKAIHDKTKAIELDPNNAKYYNSRGISYHNLNEYEKAIEDKTKAIELDPNNAGYYNSRGESYDWLSEYEKAIEDKTKAIELYPNNARYFLSIARTLCNINDFENALANLKTAISLNNKLSLPRCYSIRGLINLKKSKHSKEKCKPEVLEDLNKAISLDEKEVRYYIYRAEYYLYVNELDSAFNDLEKAITINNRYSRAYFFMARYHEMRGNNQEHEYYMTKSKEFRYIPCDNDY